MRSGVTCRSVNHVNVVLPDADASIAHFRDLYQAVFLRDLPQKEWHAYLIEIGGVIIEVFVPPTFLLNARYGAHHLGIEYEADIDEVREAVAAHKIGIVRDLGVTLHTDPADSLGAAFEFFGTSFFKMPELFTTPLQPPGYWRNEHPLQLTGLKAITLAVHDLEAAKSFLQSFLNAEPIFEAHRPELAARAIGLRVANSEIELLTPEGEGALQREMQRSGQGILSTVFGSANLEAVRDYFAQRSIALIPGTAPDRLAIAPADNLGLRFEFAQA